MVASEGSMVGRLQQITLNPENVDSKAQQLHHFPYRAMKECLKDSQPDPCS
jgi:hypothetical protein